MAISEAELASLTGALVVLDSTTWLLTDHCRSQASRRHGNTWPGSAAALPGCRRGGWMDSAFLAAAGIPTVIFGPDGDGAHADDEWVDLASATRVADALLGIVTEFCA